ncbi:MAG: ribosome biogenesis GTP-binding protein YihA/YsxC [bacterium]|jgi:GTP-binding protein|nr:ribosome biogenesis GTP-binding protein YihA/YsxC [bacterium]
MNIRSADFLTSVGFLSQLPTDGRTEIAFSGRSNVGKSSLLNRLLNRKKLVKTSRTPGKTRTLNFFTVNEAFYMVDLPGYGYAKRSMSEREQWGQLIESYVLDRPVLKGYVQLIDARHAPTDDDLTMIEWLLKSERRFVIVATKADKLSNPKLQASMTRIKRVLSWQGEFDVLPFSAVTGRGRDELWQWIEETLRG